MTDDEECVCGHDEDDHDEKMGYCTARACRCVVYRTEEEWEEGAEELDFEHDG